MFKAQPVKTVRDGRTYNGAFEIEGKTVVVSSAYGSKRGPAGRDPKKSAARLLDEIVDARH